MVTKSGILDWIEDGRGRGLDGSPLNFCFLIYPSPIDPFFNMSMCSLRQYISIQAKEMVLHHTIDIHLINSLFMS